MEGQLSIFDYAIPEEPKKDGLEEETTKDYSVKPTYEHPCDTCDIAFGSKECFLRRGYMWNEYDRGWLRDHYGKHLRIGKDKRECKYEPRNLNHQCFESERDGNRIIEGKCPYFDEYDGINHCADCPEYAWFWNQIDELKQKGYKLTEALQIVRDTWNIKSAYTYPVRSEEEVRKEDE
jgi:hypothetical protein